jgi:hypothetical protein
MNSASHQMLTKTVTGSKMLEHFFWFASPSLTRAAVGSNQLLLFLLAIYAHSTYLVDCDDVMVDCDDCSKIDR